MLSTHDKEDCVLFITNNGDQSELRAMVKVVSDYNIPIITISSSEHNHVAQHSDIVLTYGHSDENELRMGATTSLFAQMFTIDVLFYRYIALNYESSLDFITQSKMALDNYRNTYLMWNLNIKISIKNSRHIESNEYEQSLLFFF